MPRPPLAAGRRGPGQGGRLRSRAGAGARPPGPPPGPGRDGYGAGYGGGPAGLREPPPGPPEGGGWFGGGLDGATQALLAGAFVMGAGLGVWLSSTATFEPSNVASTEILDRKTPSAEVCLANGYSSMVFDQRLFVSFNPFNVYVTSPEIKPGCVFRRANIQSLQKQGIVTNKQVDECKKGMNTFAFVGDLNQAPEVSCVYHSEEAENQFMLDPKRARLGDGYAPPPPELGRP